MIQSERIQLLNDAPVRPGRYVLYWMQASQRAHFNHALEYAARQANEHKAPLLALFSIAEDYPEANERHYAFMLEGLHQTRSELARRGVQLLLRRQSPPQAAAELAAGACLVVTDRGYTRTQRAWRRQLARQAPCRVVQVESDVVVPVETASGKAEFAARTLRPKIHERWREFLVGLEETSLKRGSLDLKLAKLKLDDVDELLASLRIDRGVRRVRAFTGGSDNARRLLKAFMAGQLPRYAAQRSDPGLGIQSHQSPYLHFGQISPVYIALEVGSARQAPRAARDAYLEELIVRRELSVNYTRYTARYDSYRALPAWARATLEAHHSDRRKPTYTLAQLERAETHDPYWNAAMREMLLTGKMHGYMRMYWGKKILEWTHSPRQAFAIALGLNNRYFLDGRDPNSWANVAWCFGLHDRPWGERPIFGKVRYMNAAGLERKFDMDAYLRWVEGLR